MMLTVKTRTKTELVDITDAVQGLVDSAEDVEDGLCMLYVPHTTAAVTVNESADPAVAVTFVPGSLL